MTPADLRCSDCHRTAVWVRHTQFAGVHPFCDEHASHERNFGQSDPSGFRWEAVVDTRTDMEEAAHNLVAENERLTEDNQRIGELGRIGIRQEQTITDLRAMLAALRAAANAYLDAADRYCTLRAYEECERLSALRAAASKED